MPFDAACTTENKAHGVPGVSTDPKPNPRSKWQEHDVWYVVDRLQDMYWQQPRHSIEQVVASCKTQVKPMEGREKLLAVAKEKMQAIASG
jgi:hypothetical protein